MSLIPFALSLETNLLVDVADVQSGKKCGCVCPSCKIPLIAKKGDVKDWHFSHDSKFIEKDQELSCDYSWNIAVQMMIKQLLLEGTILALPDYRVNFQSMDYHKPKREIKITDSSIVDYNNPELKSHACDITLEVKKKKLGVLLLTKQSSSYVEMSLDKALFGVIAINIENIGYNEEGKAANHLRNHLKRLLESKTSAKQWLYHRREQTELDKAYEQDKLLEKEADSIKATQQKKSPAVKPKKVKVKIKTNSVNLKKMQWYCVNCKLEYQGYLTGLNPCPQCKSHFYRIPK